MGALVELFGVDGSRHVLSGEGTENIYLGTSPQGLYDSPVETTYKSGAFEIGGKLTKVTRRYRNLMLPIGAYGDTPDEWAEADSAIRAAFEYSLDPWDPDAKPAIIRVTTDRSGPREIGVFMSESPVMEMDTDPWDYTHSLLPVALIAPDPDWQSPADVSSVTFSGTSGEQFVTIWNPTPLPMMHTWVIAGQGTVALPDVSWTGPKNARVPGVDQATGKDHSTRMLTLEIKAEDGGGATAEVDRMKIPFRNKANSMRLVAAMRGNRLLYKVPPKTPPTQLPVWVTNAQPGLTVSCIQQRLWPRPWGLE